MQINPQSRFLLLLISISIGLMPVASFANQCTLASIYYINGVSAAADQKRFNTALKIQSLLIARGIITTEQVLPLRNPSEWAFIDIAVELANQKLAEKTAAVATFDQAIGISLRLLAGDLSYSPLSGDQALVIAKIQGFYNRALNLATTTGVTALMVGTVMTSLSAGRKSIIIAHSQGNMFANAVLASVTASQPASITAGLKIVSIATPAAIAQDMRYFTANQDRVISLGAYIAAAAKGYLLPLPANIDVPGALNQDWLGHDLLSVYLNQNLAALNPIMASINDAINMATCPVVEILSICPNIFTQTQLNKIVAGMTVPQVDNIFGCTGRSQNDGYAYLWYNDQSLLDPTMDYATVLFTNGIYLGGPNTKYIIGPVFP